jgi:outer membrane biosynthesis protein TonB
MQHARERLYFTADKGRLVTEGNAEAAFLYAAQGDEIPDSAAERFGIVDGKLKGRSRRDETLLGSSILPALVVITDTVTLQLGAIVVAAHKSSGLSPDDWNALPEPEREAKLQATIDEMKANPPQPAKPKAAAKPKKAAAEKEPPAKPKEQPAPDNKEEKATENKGG